jgi:hypothetical protein
MNFQNKLTKYLLKNELFGGSKNIAMNPNLGVESELELYIPFSGGDSSEIWPIISSNWKKNNKLGIRSKTNPEINFEFVLNHLGKIDEPILGRGTFTAVYELKNVHDQSDTTRYILRLYMRDLSISSKHMNYNQKIISEYANYAKHMIKNYYFGELKLKDTNFTYDSNKDIYEIIPNTLIDYNFDYVITKIYETPKFDKNYHVIELSNKQKFKYLYENVVMLDKLQQNNCFHADYKIGNIGWGKSYIMNPVLIDYDINTLQYVGKSNEKIKVNNNNIVVQILFPSTYIPEYLKSGSGIKAIPLDQYIKYSVGGLYNIFQVLNIKYNFDTLPCDLLKHRNITVLDSKNLGKSLHLLDTNYELIPRYYEIIKVLDMLRLNNYVA